MNKRKIYDNDTSNSNKVNSDEKKGVKTNMLMLSSKSQTTAIHKTNTALTISIDSVFSYLSIFIFTCDTETL